MSSNDEQEIEEIAASHNLGDYETLPNAPRLLLVTLAMKIDPIAVAVRGNKWVFHKMDVDPWPSRLHGHHSNADIKLDAITGNMFSIRTRQHIGRVKPKQLAFIQMRLLDSKDFSERTKEFLGEARVAELFAGRE